MKYCCAKGFCEAPDYGLATSDMAKCEKCKGFMHLLCSGVEEENKYNCILCSLPTLHPPIIPQADFLARIANGKYKFYVIRF